jgi:Phage integrase, N-terminal SAM-like domain
MPRRGDGIYLRGHTWMLDTIINGQRHVMKLGRNISKTVAGELATIERGKILRAEAGIGGKKRKDILFDKAAEEFLNWAEANKRPKTVIGYKEQFKQLMKSFGNMKLSQIHPFLLEKHKEKRSIEEARVSANREITLLKNLFNRMLEWKKFEGENPARRVKSLMSLRARFAFSTMWKKVGSWLLPGSHCGPSSCAGFTQG